MQPSEFGILEARYDGNCKPNPDHHVRWLSFNPRQYESCEYVCPSGEHIPRSSQSYKYRGGCWRLQCIQHGCFGISNCVTIQNTRFWHRYGSIKRLDGRCSVVLDEEFQDEDGIRRPGIYLCFNEVCSVEDTFQNLNQNGPNTSLFHSIKHRFIIGDHPVAAIFYPEFTTPELSSPGKVHLFRK
jgi:hypothetical protein